MKLYCTCGKFVAEIKEGSHIRKGSVMVCSNCFERFKIADNIAKMAQKEAKSYPLPDAFKDIFGFK